MNKLYLATAGLLCLLSISHAQVIVKQGFESSGDTWTSITFSTPPCNAGNGDQWDYETSLSTISPNEGAQFWGVQDLNGSCGGTGFESITLGNINVSAFTGVQFLFDYNAEGFDAGDDIKYELFYDNVGQGEVFVVNGNSNYSTPGWVTETVNVPGSVTNVSVVLSMKQNGASDYGGFDFVRLTGTPAAGVPELQLEQPVSNNQACGFTYDFGTQALLTNTDVTVRIRNTGTATLTLTTPLTVTGADAGEFSIQAQPATTIGVGSFSDMIIRFTPSTPGVKNAQISIANDDSDEDPCVINLIGEGPAPDIQLQAPVGSDQACGFTQNYGVQNIGSDTDVTVRIRNSGSADLVFTTPLTVSGADAGQFSIQSQPASPIAAGGFSDMVVRFSPSTQGVKTAGITISGNDPDESSCIVNLSGTAQPACATPPGQPIMLSFSGVTTGTIDGIFNNATPVSDGYLVVMSTNSSLSATPGSGTVYLPGDPVGGGTVIQSNANTSFSATGLSQNTTYYFFIFAFNNTACFGGPAYLTTSPLTGNATTLNGPCLSDDFNSGYGNWSGGSGTYQNSTAGRSGNGTGFNDAGDDIITATTVLNPSYVTFWLAHSSAGNKTMSVEYSGDGGSNWNNAGDVYDAAVSTTHQQFTITLNLTGTYLLRFRMSQRTSGSYYLDDVNVFCGSPTAEMTVIGNLIEIADGDNTPDVADDTDFGNAEVGVGSVVRTFTIRNDGASDLNLTLPIVINGAAAGDFAVTSPPGLSVIPPTVSTTFQVTFSPGGLGARNAEISIGNDDSDEAPYNFAITGNGTYSNASAIIADPGFSATTQIPFIGFQDAVITNSSGSIATFRFIIQDGGSGTDGDLQGTELTDITFSVAEIENIRSAALFDGNFMIANAPVISYGAETISFNGLSSPRLIAPDGGTATVSLRVSFLQSVEDQEQLIFTITSATANPSGSVFNASNAGGAVSSLSRNYINVVATELAFDQQPSDATVNQVMSPSVTVTGTDAFGNTDIDWSGSVSVTSTGSMVLSPQTAAISGGVATFSNIIHDTEGTDFELTASYTGFTSITSSLFDIITINYNNGDYRTTASGNWLNNQSSPVMWERLTAGSWVVSNSPAYNTGNAVYIRDGHTVNSGGSWGNSVNMRIMSGGTFNANHPGTMGSIYIYDGGLLTINASMGNNGLFEVEDNGTVEINWEYGDGSENTPIWWDGTEVFHPNSNLVFKDYDCADDYLIPNNTAISTNTFGGYTAAFGNVIIDFDGRLSASDDWKMLDNGVTINMAHGDLIFRTNSSAGADMRIATTGTVTSGIGGDFIVEDGYTNTQFIHFKTSGSIEFTIAGNMQLDAATTRIFAGSSGSSIVNIDGNLNITPSAVLNFNSTVATTATATVNLKGDLYVAGSGLLYNTNTSSHGILNFTAPGDGLTDATTQTIDIASTSSNENRYINFYVQEGAYVRLINRDFELGTNSSVVVRNNGVLDFGFLGTTPLNVAISGTQTGTIFSSQQGSILKITSPDGISTTGSIGNVRTVPSNRSFNQTATFHYIGKENQVTGNGITTGSTGKVIICELIDNGTQLRFTNSTGITSNTGASTTGGKLDIRRGQVIETVTEYITGSDGTLYMSPGTLYQIAKGSANIGTSTVDLIPRISGTVAFPYVLTGGTVELAGSTAGNYFQTLRGSQTRPNYIRVKYSGSNTLGADYKNLSSTTVVDSSLNITGTVVVDCINAALVPTSFIGAGSLIMDSGRLRISKLNTPNPELSGISDDYAITGGIVEFYGTDNTESQLIRGTDDRTTPRTIEYFNIEVNADAANTATYNVNLAAGIILSGVMNVNSPAVFQTEASDHIDGAGSFFIHPGATYKYGDEYGITLGNSTALTAGAIRLSSGRSIANFPTTASYGWVSTGDMVTGNALPSTILNAYLQRNLITDDVELTGDLQIRGTLDMDRGNIITTDKFLELGASTAVTGNLDYDPTFEPFIIGALQRWFDAGTNTGYSTGLFPLGVRNPSPGEDIYNRFAQVEFSTAKVSGGSLAVTFFPVRMGLAGIPINDIPAAGACASFDVTSTEEDGYWAFYDGNGLLGGNYDVTCTGEGFSTITDICQITLLKRVGTSDWFENGTHEAAYYLDAPGNTQPTAKRTGASGWSNYGFGGGPANPLPVELVAFDAEKAGEHALLTWSTVSEINTHYFELQHSRSGLSFQPVHQTAGAGTTNVGRDYSYLHHSPPTGENYYRLKVVDLDGSYEYSEVRLLVYEGPVGFDVVNTLAEETVEVILSGNGRSGLLTIYAMNGQVVSRGRYTPDPAPTRIAVDVSGLPSAVYAIQWYDGIRPVERKFIKH